MSVGQARDAGYTLLEVVVVAIILGILVSIALLSYTTSTSRARRIACQSSQRVFMSVVPLYRSEHATEPAGIEDLRPYVKNFDGTVQCPTHDGTRLAYDVSTGIVTCENHP